MDSNLNIIDTINIFLIQNRQGYNKIALFGKQHKKKEWKLNGIIKQQKSDTFYVKYRKSKVDILSNSSKNVRGSTNRIHGYDIVYFPSVNLTFLRYKKKKYYFIIASEKDVKLESSVINTGKRFNKSNLKKLLK